MPERDPVTGRYISGSGGGGVGAGTAYLPIVPQLAPGFGREIERQLGRAADGATRTMSQRFRSFGSSLRGAGTQMSIGLTAPIALGFQRVFDAASDRAEALNVTGLVFGDRAGEMGRWARNAAQAVGMSETAARTASANVGGLLSNLGFAQDETVTWSQKLVTLGSDLGSAFNREPAEAVEAIGAALRGESDPIQQFNVMLNESLVNQRAVDMGLASSTGNVDDHAKAQARLSLIMEQTASVQGDFANTADGAANKQRILRAEFQNSIATLGEQLLPIGARVLDWGASLIDLFNGLNPTVQGFALAAVAVLAAIGPIVAVIGALSTAIGFLLTPVGGVILAIAALAAGAVWAYNTFEPFRQAVDRIWEAVSRLVTGAVGAAVDWFRNAAEQVGNLIGLFRSGNADSQGFAEILDNIFGNTGRLIPFFQRLWEIGVQVAATFRDDIVPALQSFGGWVAESVQRMLPGIIAFAGTVVDVVRGVIADAVPVVREVIGFIIGELGQIVAWVQEVWPRFSEAFGHVLQVVKIAVMVVIGAIVIAWRLFGDQILAIVRIAWGMVSGVITAALDVVMGIIDFALNVINGDWGAAWGSLVDIVMGVWDAIYSVIGGALQILGVIIGSAFGAIRNVVVAVWENGILPVFRTVAGAITAAVVPVFQLLAAVVGGVWGGITTAISAAWTVISAVFTAIATAVTTVLEPPFRVFMATMDVVWTFISSILEIHRGIALAIFMGIQWAVENLLMPVFRLLGEVVAIVWQGITTAIGFAWSAIQIIWNTIKLVIDTILVPTFNFLLSVVQLVWSGIQTAITFAWGVILGIWNTIKLVIDTILVPTFNFLRDSAISAWNLIRDGISGAWGIIQGVFDAVITFVNEKLIPVWTTVRDAILGAFNTVKDTIGGIWDDIAGGIRSGIETAFGFIDTLIDGLNSVVNILPGVDLDFPNMPQLERGGPIAGPLAGTAGPNRIPRFAMGTWDLGRFGSFITRGARAIVGEGNPRYPEGVVATDPKYRRRNLGIMDWLAGKLGLEVIPKFEGGGTLTPEQIREFEETGRVPEGATVHEWGLDSAAGIAAGAAGQAVRGAALAIFRPINALVKRLLNGIPWEFLRTTAQGFRQRIYDWVKDEDDKLPEASAAGGPGKNFGWTGGGGVEQWRGVALDALRHTGSPAGWIGSLLRRMNQESGGNPRAINNWDINASRGTPSKGLMQVIDPTFNAYAGDVRHLGVWDPFANIVASIRYANARYGSAPRGWDRAGGYAMGGILPWAGSFALGGLIPGKVGAPALAGVHGGEQVLTEVQSHNLAEALKSLADSGKEAERSPLVHVEHLHGDAGTLGDLDFYARLALAGAAQAGV